MGCGASVPDGVRRERPSGRYILRPLAVQQFHRDALTRDYRYLPSDGQELHPTVASSEVDDIVGLHVIAAYGFEPPEPWPFRERKPLRIRTGELVEVERKEDGGEWAFGHLVGQPEVSGHFPLNYVVTLKQFKEMSISSKWLPGSSLSMKGHLADPSTRPGDAMRTGKWMETSTASEMLSGPHDCPRHLAPALPHGPSKISPLAPQMPAPPLEGSAVPGPWRCSNFGSVKGFAQDADAAPTGTSRGGPHGETKGTLASSFVSAPGDRENQRSSTFDSAAPEPSTSNLTSSSRRPFSGHSQIHPQPGSFLDLDGKAACLFGTLEVDPYAQHNASLELTERPNSAVPCVAEDGEAWLRSRPARLPGDMADMPLGHSTAEELTERRFSALGATDATEPQLQQLYSELRRSGVCDPLLQPGAMLELQQTARKREQRAPETHELGVPREPESEAATLRSERRALEAAAEDAFSVDVGSPLHTLRLNKQGPFATTSSSREPSPAGLWRREPSIERVPDGPAPLPRLQ